MFSLGIVSPFSISLLSAFTAFTNIIWTFHRVCCWVIFLRHSCIFQILLIIEKLNLVQKRYQKLKVFWSSVSSVMSRLHNGNDVLGLFFFLSGLCMPIFRWHTSCRSVLIKWATGSSPLTTVCSATFWNYNSAERRHLQPIPRVTAIVAPLWPCNEKLSVWRSAYSYDQLEGCCNCLYLPFLSPHLSCPIYPTACSKLLRSWRPKTTPYIIIP